VADGLSARAAQSHAVPVLAALVPRLRDAGWQLAPVVVAEQARVALGDEVGAVLEAALVVVLLGERPGLTAPDSLGAYLTWAPRPGRTDAERNCVSNIRPEGLVPALAADKLCSLMLEAARRRLSGVALKDDGRALGA
jgi:ethanolamine ammonia-lyase small subunit